VIIFRKLCRSQREKFVAQNCGPKAGNVYCIQATL